MTYSIIGILASVILFIINRDVIWYRGSGELSPSRRNYRFFLFGVTAYYITDMLWGILEANRLTTILYADTAVHFVAMAAAVMLWTRYVVLYLDDRNNFGRFLYYAGRFFLVFEVIVVAINFVHPILFSFDENGAYHASSARYVTLAIQIILFLLTAAYTLKITSRTEGKVRQRHLTIGLFGLIMAAAITIQVFYPLLPIYAMGYLLGTCLLHSFVVEDEKDEYRLELEEAIRREKAQKQELAESREALWEALTEAEQANKAKTAFLSNMSHEIRTPMNAIIGLNNIAMNDPSASEEVKGFLRSIDTSAHHLLSIINEILDMSRIEAGKMTIKHEEFSFKECLEQVNTMIGSQCDAKGLTYECLTEGKIDEYYTGDSIKLKQVLINILGNSVKFTPEGGKVSLLVEEGRRYDGKATLRFTITDNGIGMSKEFLPHLFDVFSQEDHSAVSKYGSTGLGMPITKSIVELMDGHIEVESEKGKGTTFKVTITLGESSHSFEIGSELDGSHSGSDGHPGDRVTDLEGKHILLAEDVEVNAEIMKMLLTKRGITVEIAENGRIAVDKFADNEPGCYDAILMDMRMPEMTGLEATAAIRAMEREDSKTIPIIALTANAFEEDVKRSMQAGLNAHLSKPVEPDILFATLEKLI